MVFQNYALFPHMTVLNNIAFPLKMRNTSTKKIRRRVKKALELIKLVGFENRYPNQLSGGQQQRVAIARATVFQPIVLLMDEPLGALNKKLRDHMRFEIKALKSSLNITVVYVTHDQEEALTMSDRIAIMNNGKIVQVDTPMRLYESPTNIFVADFIGKSNFFKGQPIEIHEDRIAVETEFGIKVWAKTGGKLEMKNAIYVAVRPEKIQVFSKEEEIPANIINRFYGYVEEVVYMGEASLYRIRIIQNVIIEVKIQSYSSAVTHKSGEKVIVGWHANHCLALNGNGSKGLTCIF